MRNSFPLTQVFNLALFCAAVHPFITPALAGNHDSPSAAYRPSHGGYPKPVPSPGDEARLPDLSTDERKLAYLLAVKKQVPKLFSDSAQYDINLFELLGAQAELVTTLKTDPKYVELFKKKKYFELTVEPPEGGLQLKSASIAPQAIEDWKAELKAIATANAGKSPEDLSGLTQGNLDTATIIGDCNKKIIPLIQRSTDRTAALQQYNALPGTNFQAKLTSLSSALSQDSHPFVRLITPEVRLSLQEIIPKALADLTAARKTADVIYLQAILKHKNKLLADAGPAIDSLTQEDLLFLNDKEEVLKPLVTELLPVRATDSSQRQAQQALRAVAGRIAHYASQTVSTPVVERKPVTIRQVIPPIGIFRGCTGGDCSSQYSFPYPNDPHEKVFFIEEKERGGEVKTRGYVSATEVTLQNGEKGLYVITISGSTVGAGATELILRGLHAKKAELGVQHILLPSAENIPGLINFPTIRGVFEQHTQGKALREIRYQNPEVRSAIQAHDRFNSASYDHMESNSHAVIFAPPVSARPKEKIKATISELQGVQSLEVPSLAAVEPSQILDFLLDLEHSGRQEILQRTLKIPAIRSKFPEANLKDLLVSMRSCLGSEGQPMKTEEWQTQLEAKLGALGIPPEERYFHSREPLLYPSLLKCSDAFESDRVGQTAQYLVKDFKSKNFAHSVSSMLPKQYNNANILNKLNQTDAFKTLVLPLLAALSDTDRYTRIDAARALGEIQPADERVHQALVAALKDEACDVRSNAASVLGEIKPADERVHQALVAALKDEACVVQRSAAYALGDIQPADERVHQALAAALKHTDKNTRSNAAWVLGKIQPADERGHQALLAALEDTDEYVRYNAAHALGAIKPADVRVHQALVAALKDTNANVRRSAAVALSQIKPTDPAVLHEILKAYDDPRWDLAEKSALTEVLHAGMPTEPARAHFKSFLNTQGHAPNSPACQTVDALQPGKSLEEFQALLKQLSPHLK
jgi:HEAT repeat protein